MNLRPWPVVNVDGKYNITDGVLTGVWQQLVESGRDKVVFYDGRIQSAAEFIAYVKDPYNFFTFVADIDQPKLIGFGWLNGVDDGRAYGHFCMIDNLIMEFGPVLINYWKSFNLTRVFVAIIPETYGTVGRLIEKWGFKAIGIIPEYCDMAFEEKRVGGAVFYHLGG